VAEEQNGLVTTGEGSAEVEAVTTELLGHVLLIGLNRPEKYNAFNLALINQLAQAYHRLENDPEVRCGVLYGRGKHFTSGLVWPRSALRSPTGRSTSTGRDDATRGAGTGRG